MGKHASMGEDTICCEFPSVHALLRHGIFEASEALKCSIIGTDEGGLRIGVLPKVHHPTLCLIVLSTPNSIYPFLDPYPNWV